MQHLLDDLAAGQVAAEAHLAGGAKCTAHGAAGLGADAQCAPPGIAHQHRLDVLSIGQAEQCFGCLSVAGLQDGQGGQVREGSGRTGRQTKCLRQALAQVAGQAGELAGLLPKLAVQSGPHLAGAVGRLAPGEEQAFKLRQVEIKDQGGGHGLRSQLQPRQPGRRPPGRGAAASGPPVRAG